LHSTAHDELIARATLGMHARAWFARFGVLGREGRFDRGT
jgi:hypothetical protein